MTPKSLSKDRLLDLLRKQSLLAALTPADIAALLPHLQLRTFSTGETVLQKGDPGDALMLMLRGRLQIEELGDDGSRVGLGFLLPGDFGGELALLDGEPRSAWIVATCESLVAVLPREPALQLIYNHPGVNRAMLRHLAQCVRNNTRHRAMLGIHKAETRVCAVLLSMTRYSMNTATIEALPSQQTIANMANVARETVSRTIARLVRDGVFEKDRRRLIVRDVDALQAMAGRSDD